jgi:hypothetical protein
LENLSIRISPLVAWRVAEALMVPVGKN